MNKLETWNQAKVYDGQSISDLIERTQKLIKVLECKESNVYVEECGDIANGRCEYKYEIWNYDISEDRLFFESEITFGTLYRFVKDESFTAFGTDITSHIIDHTKLVIEHYISHRRLQGKIYPTNN